ncbi:lysozyme inhibitor LprI family protein [Epilithonimonas ginsengisoli]|uniref:Lysozyme inhibitor LprI family protein n=1 Tax=Epilithonimonas ginsengisoli TaxID=1245592 RepID=A0ABU4JMJ4_9FLAO|nr:MULTISPECIES: lysozyme inhibitor LprI family protein [Chryseobacterium group]MBV6881847.1 DUF1311 domain-containing protein [Epilithonimonas sp. FP105]MDW8550901.1 lysozyme inhibitor LprI family protein [Epilithonimonas ginsengisoli]OAH69385.1 hypothetical protein AXA65_14685 [Chryseobacterium sp. FP211-J200]
MKKSISFLFLLLINVFPLAQNKIDQDLEKCLSKDNSTAGQRNCINSARDSWDKELNKSYLSLSQKLTKTGKKELVEAQRNWISFRDFEFKLIDKYYFDVKKGTLFYVIAENKKLEIVKERALQIKEYEEQFDY